MDDPVEPWEIQESKTLLKSDCSHREDILLMQIKDLERADK